MNYNKVVDNYKKKITEKNLLKKEMDIALKQQHNRASNTVNESDVPQKENNIKKINRNIFEYITILGKSEDVNKRLLTINQLLKYLKNNKHEESKHEKEVPYCLKRLIRGCGTANNNSRISFYVALVALLKNYDDGKYFNLTDCFTLVDKELHVGNILNNKEDSDAVVGHILVCSAILRSGFLFKNVVENKSDSLEQLVQLLVKSTKYRLYHCGMAFQLLCELFEHLTEEQFINVVWPHVQTLLEQPWVKHTSHSVYCLLKVKEKYPQILSKHYTKIHYGGSTILNKESYPYLYKIFWQHSNMDILIQPALHEFGKYLANAKHLCKFWSKEVDRSLEKPVKLTELITLKILTDILENIHIPQIQLHVSKLLTDNFIIMIVKGLRNLRQMQKDYDMIYAFYNDFLQALVQYCQKLDDDTEKVEIIKRLILPPHSTLNIEKLCRQRIIHQLINTLQESGIQNIFDLYKSIFMTERIKNANNEDEWLNFERMNAGYMLQYLLQNKAMQSSYKWREKQLKFLFLCGMVYVTDKGVPCPKDVSGKFFKEFGEQSKNMFYNCLQGNIYNLEKEYKLLWNLFIYCHDLILRGLNSDNLGSNDKTVHFKMKSTTLKEIQVIFKNVKESLSSHNINIKKRKELSANDEQEHKYDGVMIVFKILITYMSLQTFRESEMAIPAILDLMNCMERLYGKPNQPVISHNCNNSKDVKEPEWIEVVIDLFLHLLSHTNNCLRTLINALFPHLCLNLSLTTVHQILNVLNMKDDNNPLTVKAESDVENEVDEEYESAYSDTNGKKNADADYCEAVGDVLCGDDDDADTDDDDDDDDDYDEGDNDNDEGLIAASDKLRNAVSQALMENDAAVLKTSNNGVSDGKDVNNHDNSINDDDDMNSIDLNDLTEEQGKQLDEALSKAFQTLRKSTTEQQKLKKNKTKSQRIQSTTLMHFRVRVLDLLDIYIQYKPPLFIIVEIMQRLYEMLPYCSVGDLIRNENSKCLQQRIEKLLQKITAMKNCYNYQDDFTESDFVNFIRLILEQKSISTLLYDVMNRIRNKCIIFLIINSPPLYTTEQLESSQIITLLKEYLHEFVKSRNPTMNITLVMDIFKLRWLGVWPLAEYLCCPSELCWQTRTFRRIQIYEILMVLYKNFELHKINDELTRYYLKKLSTSLHNHISILGSITLEEKLNHSTKEFVTLLELLMTINKTCQKMCMIYELKSNELLHSLHSIRIGVHLSKLPTYRRFQQMFNLSQIEFGSKFPEEIKDGNKTENDNNGNSKYLGKMEHNSLSIINKRKDGEAEKEMRQVKKLKSQNDGPFGLEVSRNHKDYYSVKKISKTEEVNKSKKNLILNKKDCAEMKKMKKLKPVINNGLESNN